ncbi:uncharacterized protein [Tenebrio molitor]|uniref:uncharacterized protein n=1 Tax=Tenebrio molitor TaxID=7067 RepID=UPI0036247A09
MPEMENPKTSRSTAKENIVKDFDKAQAGVESMPGIELADEEDERDSFEGRYFDVASKINTLIQKTQNKEQAITTADIEKMYRQILIDSVDTDYQRILWRDHPNEELKTYRLTTLTYGTKPASFIATRCLVELAVQNQKVNPLASSIIKRDFYMDDLLTGADTISELSAICEDVSTILQEGGFNLRKWTSNVPLTSHKINNNCQKNGIVNLDNDVTKTLGLLWDSKNDLLKYDAKPIDQKSRVTKRSVLSIIAQIFDPLGIIGAVIARAKIILQKLWSLKIGWDESVPQDIHCAWINFLKELPYLQMLRIPRGMSELTQITSVELHGFCDASMSAYGATIYVRTFAENNCLVRLLCSKSRVAPLKTITLPRLELCAALLLARLIVSVKKALNIRVTKQYLWSDSMVVLAWLNNSPNTWQTFVANRTAEIQELTAIAEWRHVKGKENPADLVSRGLSPRELVDNELWFKGPSWLHSNVADLSPNTLNTAIDHDEIPERPRSPHMGGLWEINVKSVKNHIKRSIGLATPTFEEMYTLLTRIEAILNSRPLTPISNDPNDLEPLTPGHFLSPGESLTAVHEGDITEIKTNRLSRWQLIERMRQLFWRRWTREYLSRLQARSKWRNPDTTPAVGSLVLIADDDLPPLRWNLARITELHLGKDGLPRVASLKTKNGATKRSVHKLCVLPLEREDVHVLTHYE